MSLTSAPQPQSQGGNGGASMAIQMASQIATGVSMGGSVVSSAGHYHSGVPVEAPHICVACAYYLVETNPQGVQFVDNKLYNSTGRLTIAPVVMTVEGTGYCLIHGVQAYKETQQYMIAEV